jgi:hypothetical protein
MKINDYDWLYEGGGTKEPRKEQRNNRYIAININKYIYINTYIAMSPSQRRAFFDLFLFGAAFFVWFCCPICIGDFEREKEKERNMNGHRHWNEKTCPPKYNRCQQYTWWFKYFKKYFCINCKQPAPRFKSQEEEETKKQKTKIQREKIKIETFRKSRRTRRKNNNNNLPRCEFDLSSAIVWIWYWYAVD